MKQLKPISLKNNPKYNEAWLQDYIWNHSEVLELGDLTPRAKEKIQPSGGRLDLLFEDREADTPKRYECELQLGATDESHIIRTIEYWDIERKRYPQYDHVAVLVAENVTSRFLNVIHLFNGFIPLIVLKMTAYELEGDIALTFTKILDEVQLGLPEEDEISEPATPAYWENKSCKEMLNLADHLFSIVYEIDSVAKLNYNKHYIGLNRNNASANYCWFKPRKKYVNMIFKLIPADEDIMALDNAGLEVVKKTKWNEFWVKFTAEPTSEQKELIKKIIEQSRKAYGI